MGRVFLLLILTFLNCEISKNPFAPNGPFGILSLYYNLCKVGNFNYNPSNIIYLTIKQEIPENIFLPIKPNGIIDNFSSDRNLPEGIKVIAATGSISGITNEEKNFANYKIYANNYFYKEKYYSELQIQFKNMNYELGINSNADFSHPFDLTLNGQTYIYSNFSISPELPSGLNLNTNSGTITGTSSSVYNKVHTLIATRSDNVKVTAVIRIIFYEWYQEAYLKASNNSSGDNFGNSVSISGDTIVVGARFEGSNQTTITNGLTASEDNSNSSSGAVYVYKRTGTTWAQEAYIKASNNGTDDRFGNSVSISGDTIAVLSPREDSNQTTITNGTNASSDDTKTNSGAVYVYKRNGTTWAQEAYIKTANADLQDLLGDSDNGSFQTISIDGDTLVVGTVNEDSNQITITNGQTASADNSNSFSGAVYAFRRTGTSWQQEAYFKASNNNASDVFGCSVAVSGDTIAVGARFEDSNQTTITNGQTASADNSNSSSGAVYVYKRTGTTWAQEAYIKASNNDPSDSFGESLSISGNVLVVGTRFEDSNETIITNGESASSNNDSSNAGAAYVYKRNDTTWKQIAFLKASNARVNDRFGFSSSIHSSTIVVGASEEDNHQNTITHGTNISSQYNTTTTGDASGAAYVYQWNGSIWQQEAYLKASNANFSTTSINGHNFGTSVAINNDTIVVGAPGEQSNQTTITNGETSSSDVSSNESGAIYVYRRRRPN